MSIPILNSINSKNLVYGLIDPNTNDIFYIGKTIQGLDRIRQHLNPSALKNDGNTRKANKLRKLKDAGQFPLVTILYQFNIDFDKKTINDILYKKEQELINYYNILGYDLTNHQDGGPGSPGRILSETTLKKMSEKAKKRDLPEGLKNQQKSKYPSDTETEHYCSVCLKFKLFDQFYKANTKNYKYDRSCKECKLLVYGPNKNLKRRKNTTTCIAIIGQNDKEILEFKSFTAAEKYFNSTFNRQYLRYAIKTGIKYHGYFWIKKVKNA